MRRRDVLAALASAPLLSTVAAQAQDRGVYARTVVIDTLTPDDETFDVGAALAAGLTGSVVDMAFYPRDRANALEAMSGWQAAFARPGSKLLCVRVAADLARAKAEGRYGVILASQDAAILGASVFSVGDDNLDHLRGYYAMGLRVLQLTHNERNALGDSFREPANAGLSLLGRAVVAEMNRLGVMVDLSHCGDATTMEAIALSSRPVAVTHAGCRALRATPRNKPDTVIRALADKGGYFGVFNVSNWLTPGPAASVDLVVDHIEHLVKVGGEDLPGFGSDTPVLADPRSQADKLKSLADYMARNAGLPGAEPLMGHTSIAALDGPDRMHVLADALARRGHKAALIEKVLGGNFTRAFKGACG
jgi:membrane dipeptidase